MKLGDVIRKEREKRSLDSADIAARLGISEEAWLELESGETDAERWGPLLAQIAIKLSTPTSRLLAETGRSCDVREGGAGSLIQQHRERRSKTTADMAELLGISQQEYDEIEAGTSPIEKIGPLLLGFAEVIEQPVFNLFYPCGLDFRALKDYP